MKKLSRIHGSLPIVFSLLALFFTSAVPQAHAEVRLEPDGSFSTTCDKGMFKIINRDGTVDWVTWDTICHCSEKGELLSISEVEISLYDDVPSIELITIDAAVLADDGRSQDLVRKYETACHVTYASLYD